MILYHTTTVERADSIMVSGFRDTATVNKRLTANYQYPPGVWFADVPPLDDDLFDGIGLFDFDAEKQTFIAITIPAILRWPCEGVQSSAADSTWPGTQYWAKAAIWNQFSRARLSLDDVIRIRLDPAFMAVRHSEYIVTARKQIDLAKKYAPRRDYGKAFAARVMRVLKEMDAEEEESSIGMDTVKEKT
jgi:hypothetical protein